MDMNGEEFFIYAMIGLMVIATYFLVNAIKGGTVEITTVKKPRRRGRGRSRSLTKPEYIIATMRRDRGRTFTYDELISIAGGSKSNNPKKALHALIYEARLLLHRSKDEILNVNGVGFVMRSREAK